MPNGELKSSVECQRRCVFVTAISFVAFQYNYSRRAIVRMMKTTLSCCCSCLVIAAITIFCREPQVLVVTGFVQTPVPLLSLSKTHYRNLSKLQSSPLFQPDQNDNDTTSTSSSSDDDNEFQGFNPFTPGAKMPTKGGFGILSDADRKQPNNNQTPGGQISPRQMKMKELTTELLLNISDDDMISKLLLTNEEFLLEQLNNLDAVLEPDSVLSPDMTREERFRQYEKVMNERITGARAPVAKKALGVLRDFVLSRE